MIWFVFKFKDIITYTSYDEQKQQKQKTKQKKKKPNLWLLCSFCNHNLNDDFLTFFDDAETNYQLPYIRLCFSMMLK